jgi:hypothetical protein
MRSFGQMVRSSLFTAKRGFKPTGVIVSLCFFVPFKQESFFEIKLAELIKCRMKKVVSLCCNRFSLF